MLNIYLKISTSLFLASLISACSLTGFSDIFSSYNEQMQNVKIAQQQGDFEQALTSMPKRNNRHSSYNLSLLEKARLEFLTGKYLPSQKHFELAYLQIQKDEQAAKIQLSRSIQNATAVVSNDNVMSYVIPYYEQSMLHSYQALNYLNKNDLPGALVEIRRANLVQSKALKANQKTLHSSQQKMLNEGVGLETLANKYPSQVNAIGQVKNGFQNAYTFYLSGVLYEAAGKANDAYIDYKKALEIYPANITLQKDVWRLANRLGMDNDILNFKEHLAPSITKAQKVIPQSGQLVIISEHGIINNKQEVSFNLPVFTHNNNMRFYSVALPRYSNNLRHYSGLSINYQGKQYQSQEIVRLQSLAAKQLQDTMPAIVTRQIIRLIAKEKLRQKISNQGGDIGNILASLYNIVSEKADTRSWSTLPDSIHILRLNLTSGQHTLKLNIAGENRTITVDINQNRQTLITLTSINKHLSYQNITL